jgi:membrane-bound acyltransferase YfiQ involved in biofilm formation
MVLNIIVYHVVSLVKLKDCFLGGKKYVVTFYAGNKNTVAMTPYEAFIFLSLLQTSLEKE